MNGASLQIEVRDGDIIITLPGGAAAGSINCWEHKLLKAEA
jgi:hypothetical protein